MRETTIMTVSEVAKFLKISKNKVYELVKSGELPAIKFGKSIRICKSDVYDYISNALKVRK